MQLLILPTSPRLKFSGRLEQREWTTTSYKFEGHDVKEEQVASELARNNYLQQNEAKYSCCHIYETVISRAKQDPVKKKKGIFKQNSCSLMFH